MNLFSQKLKSGLNYDLAVHIECHLILYNLGIFTMEQNANKIQAHEDTKKLSFAVVFLSLFVIAIFGLAPLV